MLSSFIAVPLLFFMSVKIRTGPGVESVNIEGFMFLLDLNQFQPKPGMINGDVLS